MTEEAQPSPVDLKNLNETSRLGQFADFSSLDTNENDPVTGPGWPAERTVSASTIIELCTQENTSSPVHAKGVRIRGARISGKLDFEAMKLLRPLYLENCFFEEPIDLTDAQTRTLCLDGSHVPGIFANRVKIQGGLFLRKKFVSTGEIRLGDANVEGSISVENAEFKNPNKIAFEGTRLKVSGSFILSNKFKSEGEIRLIEANLGGSLAFVEATLQNKTGKTIDAERLTTRGGVYLLNKFTSFGRIKLHSAQVGGIFECSNGTIHGSNDIAIEARGIHVNGAVLLRNNFFTTGVVNLSFARIGVNLEFTNADLRNGNGLSLEASEARVGGSVSFTENFRAMGGIRLDGSSIGGDLLIESAKFAGGVRDEPLFTAARVIVKQNLDFDKGCEFTGKICIIGSEIGGNVNCRKASFINVWKTAFEADQLSVKGQLFLGADFTSDGELRLVGSKLGAGFRVESKKIKNREGVAINCDRLSSGGTISFESAQIVGELRLTTANIEGDLILKGTVLGSGTGKTALNATGISVKGDVLLNEDFEALGDVSLRRAQINGDLNCEAASFKGKDAAFAAVNTTVGHTLTWKRVTLTDEAQVNLDSAAVAILQDDSTSWPNNKRLSMNDFSYASFGEQTLSTKERLAWLRSQRVFSVQPYEQLIRVLRNKGYDQEARQIARAKQDDLRQHGKIGIGAKAWNWLSGTTIGHGYQLWKALITSVFVILVGTLIFYAAFKNGFVLPVKDPPVNYIVGTRCPDKVPCFNPLIYSIDVFLPIVDLRQESYWLPVANKRGRSWYEGYYWLHIVLGWVFTTLSVAGLTGLVKKDN